VRLRAMTFNVRYDNPGDGADAWTHRRARALAIIGEHAPDLIALQEPTPSQWQDIADHLPDYSIFGRDDDAQSERPGGFFRTERFESLDRGLFWLSDTPSTADSETWPHDWGPRACAWVRLRDVRAGRDLLFASTHFDTNAAAWLPSATVFHAELNRAAGGAPVVAAGDFNCPAGSPAHRYLCAEARFRDAWLDAGCADAGVVTFNGFTPVRCLPKAPDARFPSEAFDWGNYRIDWVLVRGEIACVAAAVDQRHDGRLPSDHYPVIADIVWTAANTDGPGTSF
jgi:endonuclease/exonuclease/phosphatase family metal-dependent hydrolase